MKCFKYIVLAALAVVIVPCAFAVKYVDGSASGNNDGTSWTDAFEDMVTALAETIDGEEMWVAEGTYAPATGDDESFYVTNNVMYGGFPAGGGAWGTRDPVANETILDGESQKYHIVEKAGNTTATIDGFTFQDGTADAANPDDDGAALYVFGGNVVVSNCVFKNNTANDYAGAVWIDSANTPSPRFVNCTFENNTATGNDGGAIFFENGVGDVYISDCTFSGNSNGNGGDERGGAISAWDGGVMTIVDCVFTNNSSFDEGGAISIEGDIGGMFLNVSGSEFYNNSGVRGGAIYFQARNNATSQTNFFSNCVFRANTVTSEGGAIRASLGDGWEFVNCSFTTNYSSSQGGALMLNVYNVGMEARFINCGFTNNIANIEDGGAIRMDSSGNMGPMLVTNCTFNGNRAGTAADDRGGAIYAEDGDVMTVIDCLFTNNTAGDEGGAIALQGDSDGTTLQAYNTKFYDNTGGNGGAVYTRSYGNGDAVVSNCWFVDNYASSWGGALRMENADNVKIVDCFFPTNYAAGGGGHMYVFTRSGYTGIVANINFTNGIANIEDGGAIQIDNQAGQTWIITNCNFISCRAGTEGDDRGGAINAGIGALLTVVDCGFTNNSAGDEGGAISIYGDSGGMKLDARNLTFTGNSGGNGGALYLRAYDNGMHVITNCTFSGSYASSWGGAVRIENTDYFKLVDCAISDSTANSGGGHAYLQARNGTTGYVYNVNFTNGLASTDDAGAVMIGSSSGQNMIFTNCQFVTSQCGPDSDDRGGVISAEDANILTFIDCLFTNVTAGDEGGVISVFGDAGGAAVHLYGCELNGSTGADRGGGLFLRAWSGGGDHIISNCTFRNLESSGVGGGICLDEGSSIKIYNTSFSQCDSTGNDGGALWLSPNATAVVDVINCTFHENTASSDGGAIFLDTAILNVTNSIFRENTASGYGDEILGTGDDTLNMAFCNVDQSEIGTIGVKNIGDGMINTNPLFADEDNGDYHLQSLYGRWNGIYFDVTDTEFSPCIDTGYTNSAYSRELPFNGGRINMGCYGNTPEASKSAYSPAEVANIAVSALASNSVDVVGTLVTTGATADVYIYYGFSDKGENFTWDFAATNLGYSTGHFTNTISITPDRVMYWRCYATNVYTNSWAPETHVFMSGAAWVQATDATASEITLDTGEFTLSRSAEATNGEFTVYYSMGGTAANGTDYTLLPGAYTFAEGESSTTLTVTPLTDSELGEPDETAILTITDTGKYVVGVPASDTVVITNDATGSVVYVDGGLGTGNNDGSSWTDAYQSLTNALQVGDSTKAYWIKNGTYALDTDNTYYFDIGDKDLYGGFVGNETHLNDRDWTTYETILETGGADQRVVYKNSSGEAILDGLVIKDGNETGNGAGMLVDSGTVIIRNCLFTNNVVTGNGGAICFNSDSVTHLVTNTLFATNSATLDGGVVYLQDGDADYYKCTFRDNTANDQGGAIWIDSNDKPNSSFYDCGFTNNTAPNNEGGAIYIEDNRQSDWGTFLFQSCTFDSNSAGNADNEGGGCIYAMEGDFVIKIIDCLFTNNSANQEGGCIFMEGADFGAVVQIFDSRFYNNSATDGGCVWQNAYIYNNETIISNCWFSGNTATSEGGALYMLNTDGFKVMDCWFPTNQATSYGGHAYLGVRSGYAGLVANSSFTNGVAVNEDGGAIYFQNIRDATASFTVTNCTFDSNVAGTAGDDRGGAIYAIEVGSMFIDNCLFTNNVAGDEGGAVCVDGGDFGPSLTLLNSQFYNNTGGNGGAVYHSGFYYGGHLVSNCVFRENTASADAGALFMINADGFTMTDCSFPTNRATSDGGHCVLNVRDGYEGKVDNCTFENGSAVNDDGGAVKIETSRSTMAVTFTNCTFRSCWAGSAGDDRGGAIYATEGGILTVHDCLITNVTAGDEGGAICIDGGDFSMILNMFDTDIYDSSGAIGGAVWLYGWDDDNGYTIISNSSFRNCSASGQGGAIHLADVENTEIINSAFSYCDSSGNQGGAIYKSPGATDVTTINNCTFHTNTSSTGGGAIYLHEGILNVSNSIFYANFASGNGDEIYGDGGDTLNMGYCNIDTSLVENIGTRNYDSGLLNTNPLFFSAISNDYHLLSEDGRWDPNTSTWTNDVGVLSPCIEFGNPEGPFDREPQPHGRRNNMGRYGNTDEASKHAYLWVENDSVSDILSTSATLHGELISTNALTDVYIYYGTVNAGTNKTWQNTLTTASASVGMFSNSATLTPGQVYFWRCYASNSVSEHWATNVLSFQALNTPTVTNGASEALSWSSASISAGLEAGGYADAWFCWSTNDAGTSSTSDWDNVIYMGSVTQDIGFSTTVTGIESNKTYWFRSFVTNAYGTDWSDEASAFSAFYWTMDPSYKLKITFTNFAGRGVLTNFPALVKLTLFNTVNYQGFIDTTNGYDLRFWTNDGLTGAELNYEIENWEGGSVGGISSPTDISGCTLWLDAGQGITTDGSGNVTTWADQSGVGNDVTSSGSAAPALVSSEINSRDVIRFGGDDYLESFSVPLYSGDDDYTYFAVWKKNDVAGTEVIMEQNTLTILDDTRATLAVDASTLKFWGQNNDYNGPTIAANSWYVSDMKVDNSLGNNISIFNNNTESAGTSSGGAADLNVGNDKFRLGAEVDNTEYLSGDIAEVIVYTNALTDAERALVRQYLDDKYGLNGNLSSDESFVWVKIPELTNNLSIWAAWGDPNYTSQETYTTNGDVWSDGFVGVFHLHGDGSDSSTNNHQPTLVSDPETTSESMIANAHDFDGGDELNYTDHNSLDLVSAISLSGWFRTEAWNQWSSIISKGSDAAYEIEADDNTGGFRMRINNETGSAPEVNLLSLNTWYYVSGTYDKQNAKLYIDGLEVDSDPLTVDINVNATTLSLGDGSNNDRITGQLDEMRVSNIARNSNWVWACWMNQGGNHNNFSKYDTLSVAGAEIYNTGASPSNTYAELNGELGASIATNWVYVHWGKTDEGTNFTWTSTALVGIWTNNASAVPISYTNSGLTIDTEYFFTYRATNSFTNVWANPSWGFRTTGTIEAPTVGGTVYRFK